MPHFPIRGDRAETEPAPDVARMGAHWRWWLLGVPVLALVTYGRGLRGEYFADDFQFYFGARPSLLYFFTHPNPHNGYAYRPIEAATLSLIQQSFGTATWPIHALQLALHVGVALLVFHWMRRTGFSSRAALLGSAFLLVSQANAHAVLSNDTLSQLVGTLGGALSLVFAHAVASRKDGPWSTRAWLLRACAVLAFAVSLAGKETSVGFVAGIFLVLCAMRLRPVRIVGEMAPFLAVLVGYFAVRALLGLHSARIGGGRLDLQFGPGVLKNLGLYLMGSMLPVSSADAFVAIRRMDAPLLLAMGAALAASVTALALGLWRVRDLRMVLFALLWVTALVPVIALNRPSELYAYNAMPALAVLVGVAFDALLTSPSRPRAVVVGAWLSLLLLLNIAGVWSKARRMSDAGRRAGSLIAQIVPYAQQLPPGALLALVQPESEEPEYSVFYINGFNLISGGTFIINERAGRPDIEVRIVQPAELSRLRHSGTQFLRLDGDLVLPWDGDRS